MLALGYLALGLATAWHAPHFSQALASLDVDRHVEHEAVFDGACALCTVKPAPQLGAARFLSRAATVSSRAPEARDARLAATDGAFSARPRAPPSILS
jgi:hypothetical protein